MSDYPTEFAIFFDGEDEEEFHYGEKGKQLLAEARQLASSYEAVSITDKTFFPENVWKRFDVVYDYAGVDASHSSVRERVNAANMIRIAYDGKLDSLQGFDVAKCHAIATYEEDHGFKLTSLCRNVQTVKSKVRAASIRLINDSLAFSWHECERKAEILTMLDCNGKSCIIDPQVIAKIYDIKIASDGKHYFRKLPNTGVLVERIASGVIEGIGD